MLLTVDVLGLKVDVFVVDVLKVHVLEVVQMGRPGDKYKAQDFRLSKFKRLQLQISFKISLI
jgi:hypothetical protein